MDNQKILKYLDYFSIITVGENKVPNFPWRAAMTEKISKEQLTKQLECKTTKNFGLVTGFENLEVIDVDLKVFNTAHEQKDFWEEYITHLRDNILDFEEKFVVYKTKNAGYHILYKSEKAEKNTKLAKLKGDRKSVV